jgi:AbiV family abortive infection protein
MIIYRDWAKSAATNASQLAIEARILERNGHLSRAYYLCHMAIEESSKAILLASSYTNGVEESQLPKIKGLLQDHKKKISFVVELARETSPLLAQALQGKEADLVSHMNNMKNDTMYVSLFDGKITTPEQKIAKVDVVVHIELAERMVELATKMATAC